MQNNQANEITTEILKAMTGTVGKIIGHSHGSDVADCAQDACLRAIENGESFDSSKASYKTWCCTIAANTAKNWRKAKINNGHDSQGFADDNGETSQLVDTMEGSDGRIEQQRLADYEQLTLAMDTLDRDESAFIRLIAQDVGQSEAGELVGWSAAKATRRRKDIAAKLASHF